MKRIIIICEGQTEQEFCTKTLRPYFIEKNYYLQCPLIKKSQGGVVKWIQVKKEIENYLKSEKDVFVTSLIDYYGIHAKFEFPNWAESLLETDKSKRLDILENSMQNDIDPQLNYRYIPYMQLHEFEGLLFNNIEIFYSQIPNSELVGLPELKRTFLEYDNPEMINNNSYLCPSKRLGRIILGYDKVVYGNILAEAIGLENIRRKSPRFNNWIENLEKV